LLATKSEWPAATGHSCERDTANQPKSARRDTVASASSTDKRAALPKRAFFRARLALLDALEALLCRRWNRRRARLNKALSGVLHALIGHADFAQGGRVALTVEHLARMLRCTERTIRRAIAQLATLPELIRVLRVGRGEPSYDGRPARVAHLEWQLGPEAKSLVDRVTAERPPPGHGAPWHPDTVPPDHELDQGSNSKFSEELFAEPEPLEMQAEPPPGPLPLDPSPLPEMARPALDVPPVECRELHHPVEELEVIVRQHRELAEPERTVGGVVFPEELATVDAALDALGTASPAERRETCARVSELARHDAARKGQPRATLRYAFAEPWFAERVARLREDRERQLRETADAELTARLLGIRPPVRARPRPVEPSIVQPKRQAPRSRPLPLEQAQGYIAAILRATA
jgi:hypothetical protein